MVRDMHNLLAFVVDLETQLNERDEWLNAQVLYARKRDLLRKYGQPGEEVQQAIQELDDRALQAQGLLEGVTAELLTFTGTDDPEEARRRLIHLKTILNTYAEKTGKEFFFAAGLEDKSADEVLALGHELIRNE